MKGLEWNGLGRYRDAGLLVMRAGLGLSMMAHGVPKLMPKAGAAGGYFDAMMPRWEGLGSAMHAFGIHGGEAAFGIAAALAETLGGLFVALGLFTRPAAAAVAFTMFVAFFGHAIEGDGFRTYGHAMDLMFAFFGIMILGPGRYRLSGRGA